MRSLTALLLAAIVVTGCGAAAGSTTSLTEIGAGLQGPAGLSATIYATDLANVSAFAFDADGRLWAATASYADDGDDGVYLVDAAGAAPTPIITGLHTALGLIWVDDVLFVASAGRVDAYSDLAAGTFATTTNVLTLPDGSGEVNGLALSPDGRLMLGISASCNACTTTSTYDATVISFRPDGGDVRVEASGIRAPVGLAYVPDTADLLVTMNQPDDLGDATPGDWLAVVTTGQTWGFPDCYGQGGAACVGVPEPLAVLDTHAAVSGVAVVTGGLGASIGTSALVAEWATGKVMRVALEGDGSTASAATVEPFLTGLEQPVPLATAPDGALYVGDWGSGTIYRVARA